MKAKTYILMKDLPDTLVFKKYKDTQYYVSQYGQVYSFFRGKFLKGYLMRDYLMFDIYIGTVSKKIAQHRLIAECFIPNPNNYPLVRHLNDNKFDIRIENLAWGTKSDNMNDAVLNGKIKNRPIHKGKLNEQHVKAIKIDLRNGVSVNILSEKYKVCFQAIYQIKNGKSWKNVD